ncbi:uncharacterized protein LOC141856600 [Brevipalpus obovatus]|uniref:uncharacterized protein LOC141856600 n=1 Tax=Brevipalpus obovatus TaxID=246614 RepID=UPI003D9F4A3A
MTTVNSQVTVMSAQYRRRMNLFSTRSSTTSEDSLFIQVYRRIADGIPPSFLSSTPTGDSAFLSAFTSPSSSIGRRISDVNSVGGENFDASKSFDSRLSIMSNQSGNHRTSGPYVHRNKARRVFQDISVNSMSSNDNNESTWDEVMAQIRAKAHRPTSFSSVTPTSFHTISDTLVERNSSSQPEVVSERNSSTRSNRRRRTHNYLIQSSRLPNIFEQTSAKDTDASNVTWDQITARIREKALRTGSSTSYQTSSASEEVGRDDGGFRIEEYGSTFDPDQFNSILNSSRCGSISQNLLNGHFSPLLDYPSSPNSQNQTFPPSPSPSSSSSRNSSLTLTPASSPFSQRTIIEEVPSSRPSSSHVVSLSPSHGVESPLPSPTLSVPQNSFAPSLPLSSANSPTLSTRASPVRSQAPSQTINRALDFSIQPEEEGPRRSKRKRLPKLQTWRGERPIYELDEQGFEIIAGVTKPSTPDHLKRKRRVPQRTRITRLRRSPTPLPPSSPVIPVPTSPESVPLSPSFVTRSERELEDIRDANLVSADLDWKFLKGTDQVLMAQQREFVAGDGSKTILGWMKMLPFAEKPSTKTGNYELCLMLQQGKATIKIGDRNPVIMPTMKIFTIPSSSSYSLRNLIKNETLFQFVIVRSA